jgi:hypothetical protein
VAKKPPSNNGGHKGPPDLHDVNANNPPPPHDEEEQMAEEEIDRVTKAFAAMLRADATGKEPDLSEFEVGVAPEVKQAIAEINTRMNVDLNSPILRSPVSVLFESTGGLQVNEGYRKMTPYALHHLAGDHAPFLSGAVHDMRSQLEKNNFENRFRRLDAELRQLDSITRDEITLTFVNTILSSNFGNYSPAFTSDYFHPLSEDSRDLLRNLVMYYFDARDLGAALAQACKKAKGNHLAAEDIEGLIKLQTQQRHYPVHMHREPIRDIRPEALYQIVLLAKALLAIFPRNLRISIEAALEMEGINSDLTAPAPDQVSHSKYIRNNFIAIAQNRGSFESFYTALFDYHWGLQEAMNEKIKFCRNLIATCDTLKLDIARVLRSSKSRLQDDLTFETF